MQEKTVVQITDTTSEEYRERVIRTASRLCCEYKLKGYHCSESTIRACSEAMGFRLSDDVLRSASGFRGGGGGAQERCGVLEAGCMLVSYLYGRVSPAQPTWPYSYLIRVLHQRFRDAFHTIRCGDILEVERAEDRQPICMQTYDIGAAVVTRLLLDADELLRNIPPEELDK